MLSATFALTACQSSNNLINVDTKPPLNLENPNALILTEIDYHILTDKNADTKFLQSTKKGDLPVFICLTPSDYQAQSLNIQTTERYIQESILIIQSYKDYYEPENEEIE